VEWVKHVKKQTFPKPQQIAKCPDVDLEAVIPARSTSPILFLDRFKHLNHLAGSHRGSTPSSPVSRAASPGFGGRLAPAPSSPGPLYMTHNGFSTYEHLKSIMQQAGLDEFPAWLPVLPQSPAPSPGPRSPMVLDTPRAESPMESPQFDVGAHRTTSVLTFHPFASKSRAVGLGLRPDSPRLDTPRFKQPQFPPQSRRERRSRIHRSYSTNAYSVLPRAAHQKSRYDRDQTESDEDKDIRTVKSDVEHPGYRCDGCGDEPIKGVRYKCKDCAEMDLCEQCVKTNTSIGKLALSGVDNSLEGHVPTHNYDIFETPEAPYYDVEYYQTFEQSWQ